MEINTNKKDESYIIVKEFISEYLDSQLQKPIIHKPYHLFIKKTFNIKNNITLSCIISLKQNKGNLCGFYTLFYTYYYIKYLETSNPLYLHLMNSRFKFYKFYFKLLKLLLNKFPSDKQILITEETLERYHMNFILQNYSTILLKNIQYKYTFHWIDYSMGTFIGDKEKISLFHNFISNIKHSHNEKYNHFLYVGISVHWILIHINVDNCNNSNNYNILLFDSFGKADKILDIDVSNENDISQYIEQSCSEEKYIKHEPLNDYEKNSFRNLIKDYHYLFKDISLLLTSSNPLILYQLIIEHHATNIMNSFYTSLSISKEISLETHFSNTSDKLLILLNIYYWLLSQYHPNIISDNIYSIIELANANKGNEYQLISSPIINKFYTFLNTILLFLTNSIHIINENDIIQLLTLFINVIKHICHNFNNSI